MEADTPICLTEVPQGEGEEVEGTVAWFKDSMHTRIMRNDRTCPGKASELYRNLAKAFKEGGKSPTTLRCT